MRLKEIKPGMAIHCKNNEEKKALLEEAERLGYLWSNGTKPTKAFFPSNTLVFQVNGLKKYISWTGDSKKNTEFSDLILHELTAEEVLQAMGEICESHQVCNDCPINKAIKDNGKGTSYCFNKLHTHTDKVINVCAQWKSDHEKKEPEIETVDVCRIIEVMPDGRKRCVHEEDIVSELAFGGDECDIVHNTLKRYCMEHEGEFIAVHEVVSRVKVVE